LKRIARPHAFVENEQWSVVHMKEEFHARFATILQILYLKKGLIISTIRLPLLLT
jgi:hypothetical protein